MADYPENRIVVDGSSKYLAIRLPREDDSIAPLRQLLKSEGFYWNLQIVNGGFAIVIRHSIFWLSIWEAYGIPGGQFLRIILRTNLKNPFNFLNLKSPLAKKMDLSC